MNRAYGGVLSGSAVRERFVFKISQLATNTPQCYVHASYEEFHCVHM